MQRKKKLPNPPTVVGLLASTLLFLLFIPNALSSLSPMGNSYAYDYFTLPRCGLALRNGTNIFTSAADYPHFGYFATNWVSHPVLCTAGIPLSYMTPWAGFWFTTVLYWILHMGILIAFGSELRPRNLDTSYFTFGNWQIKDYVAMACLGFFFPWYVLYVLGQYHALAVCALTLVLLSESKFVLGFTLSAIGKPVLAPAGLVLICARQWKPVLKITGLCLLCYLPWLFLRTSPSDGFTFGLNHDLFAFFEMSSRYTRYSVPGWNQEMGWSKVFDEFYNPAQHLALRYLLASIPLLAGVILAFKGRLRQGIALSTLWFFILYGRGHEYHHTLYLPILAFFYCNENGNYRNWFTVSLIVLCAMPTAYPLFLWLYDFSGPNDATLAAMSRANSALYWIFLLQRPIVAPLLIGLVLKTEFYPKRIASLRPRSADATPTAL